MAVSVLATPTVEEAIARIRARNGAVRAVLRPLLEEARAQAASLAKEPPRSALHGVPYLLKDVWDVAGVPTTGGSFRHRARVPEQSGTVHSTFERAGAVLVGRSNLSDLGLSLESDNCLLGPTANPHDLSRTSGGSTGGGAAGIADGMAAFDWGSDFAGSIRIPAAFCGVVGLRLSSKVWPAREHFPKTPPALRELNGMGPLAASVAGCRTILETVAPTLRAPGRYSFSVRGIAIYGPDDWAAGQWPSFAGDVTEAASQRGLRVRPADGWPSPRDVEVTYDWLLSSHFDEFLQTREIPFREGLAATFTALVLGESRGERRLHRHTARVLALLSAGRLTIYRHKGRVSRRVDALRRAANRLWDDGWLLATPTTTHPAPPHGQLLATRGIAAFAKLGNLVDATAIALPFGRFPCGLPRSLQILGPPGSEEVVLDVAERFERAAY